MTTKEKTEKKKKVIESLTPEQQSRFQEFVDRWISIGLCTEPANRKAAEEGVIKAYEIQGLKPPEEIIWCGSPVAMVLARLATFALYESLDALASEIQQMKKDGRLPGKVAKAETASVAEVDTAQKAIREAVRKKGVPGSAMSWEHILRAIQDEVEEIVETDYAPLKNQILKLYSEKFLAGLGAPWDLGYPVYGQHDAGWLSFYDYFREVCGLEEETAKLAGLFQVAQSAGWFLPHEHVCWISERHSILRRDDRGRLHCVDGPAVQYPDGWSLFAVHGVLIPAEKAYIVEDPSKITVKLIEDETNAEIRRIMIEQFGQERYIQESGAEVVASDDFGTLYRKEVPNDEPLMMVKVVNATQEPDGSYKDYWLRVPPDLRPMLSEGKTGEPQPLTARNAVACTFGLTGDEYEKMVQET